MQQSGKLRVFALQATQRLHAGSATGTKRGAPAGEAIRLALASALSEPAVAQAQQQSDQTTDNQSVGHAIRSLQLLGTADWRGLIARASPLGQQPDVLAALRGRARRHTGCHPARSGTGGATQRP